jgi:hypothetical protein
MQDMSSGTLVSVETPVEIHTFISMGVAFFKPVCTLVHNSFTGSCTIGRHCYETNAQFEVNAGLSSPFCDGDTAE